MTKIVSLKEKKEEYKAKGIDKRSFVPFPKMLVRSELSCAAKVLLYDMLDIALTPGYRGYGKKPETIEAELHIKRELLKKIKKELIESGYIELWKTPGNHIYTFFLTDKTIDFLQPGHQDHVAKRQMRQKGYLKRKYKTIKNFH